LTDSSVAAIAALGLPHGDDDQHFFPYLAPLYAFSAAFSSRFCRQAVAVDGAREA
jgi:hypothetical protein